MKKHVLILIAACAILVGCAPLDKNADPLIVRAEQTEQTALASFDLLLRTEYKNHDFFAEHIPGVVKFADWLREPQTVDGTNTWPRATAMIKNLNNIKTAYKANRSQSNLLVTVEATLSQTIREADAWINTAKTQNPNLK